MDECFCKDQKIIQMGLFHRLFNCIGTRNFYEKPIKTPCCNQNVHSSCMKTYLLNSTSQIIDNQPDSETSTLVLKDLAKCCYCKQVISLPNMMYSYKERELEQNVSNFKKVNPWTWTFMIIFLIFNGLADPILIDAKMRSQFEDYCISFNDTDSCLKELKDADFYKVIGKSLMPIGITPIMLLLCSFFHLAMSSALKRTGEETGKKDLILDGLKMRRYYQPIINFFDELGEELNYQKYDHYQTLGAYKAIRVENEDNYKKCLKNQKKVTLLLVNQLFYTLMMFLAHYYVFQGLNPESIDEMRDLYIYYLVFLAFVSIHFFASYYLIFVILPISIPVVISCILSIAFVPIDLIWKLIKNGCYFKSCCQALKDERERNIENIVHYEGDIVILGLDDVDNPKKHQSSMT